MNSAYLSAREKKNRRSAEELFSREYLRIFGKIFSQKKENTKIPREKNGKLKTIFFISQQLHK